jgi:hypothetical protein
VRLYVTFGGKAYETSTELILSNAPYLGVDKVLVYDEAWVTEQTDFYEQNRWCWEHPHKRGFGWYIWKPYVMLDALERVQEGDFVLYTDADTYPVRNLSVLFQECQKEGIMLFEASAHQNRPWLKRDCAIVMAQDDDRYRDVQHAVARFLVIQKGRWKPKQLLMEWLTYTANPLANTFDPSTLAPEKPGFVEHRCEQAILTLLAHKYRYRLYREACQAGDGSQKDRDLYPERLFWQEDIGRKGDAVTPTSNRFRNV